MRNKVPLISSLIIYPKKKNTISYLLSKVLLLYDASKRIWIIVFIISFIKFENVNILQSDKFINNFFLSL